MSHLRVYLAALLLAVTAVVPASTQAADLATDVPGVLWSARSVDATVGGSTFDRVWRLVLTEGRVVQLRTEGLEAGAQLGLYLLNDSIVSLGDAGFDSHVLKASAKAGGTQSVTAALVPGTYYLNVNGRNQDRAYKFRITATLIPDVTPPTVTTSLTNGKSRVSSTATTMRIAARDTLSGVSAYRTRVLGTDWTDWTAVETASLLNVDVPIELRQIVGLQRVDVQARNSLGLISDVVSDSVYLDQVKPVVRRIDKLGANSVTTASRPAIVVGFNEPMSTSSWLNGGMRVTTPEGVAISGTFTFSSSLNRGTWQPRVALPLGTTIVVSPGEAQDAAGNLAEFDSFTLTYLAATKLVGAAVSGTPFIDVSLKVSVASSGILAGSTVWLERYTGAKWEGDLSTTLTATGARLIVDVPESGRYRWRYQSDGLRKEAISNEFTLAVRPRLVLTGQSSSSTRSVVRGQAVTIVGVANPVSTPVNLTLYSCNSSFSSCTPGETTPLVPGADGRFSLTWTPAKGYWAWGVKSAATADYSAGSSPLYRLRAP